MHICNNNNITNFKIVPTEIKKHKNIEEYCDAFLFTHTFVSYFFYGIYFV